MFKIFKYKCIAIITKDEIKIDLIEETTSKFYKKLIVIPSYLSKYLDFACVIVYNNRENSYRKNERNLLYIVCVQGQNVNYMYIIRKILIKKHCNF